jgi:hypothetical protein
MQLNITRYGSEIESFFQWLLWALISAQTYVIYHVTTQVDTLQKTLSEQLSRTKSLETELSVLTLKTQNTLEALERVNLHDTLIIASQNDLT